LLDLTGVFLRVFRIDRFVLEQLRRGEQDEKCASIRMRKCPQMRDDGKA